MRANRWIGCALVLAGAAGCDRPERPPARAGHEAVGPSYLAVPAGAVWMKAVKIAGSGIAGAAVALPRGTHTLVYDAGRFRLLWGASGLPGARPEIDFARFNVLVLRVRDGENGGPAVYAGEGRTIVLLEEGRHPAAPEPGTHVSFYRIPIDGGPVTHIGFQPRGGVRK